ncbi:hypothetical protein BD31_I0887 [Candidatus Nitrosopumilus salaria BD31]|uniref:Uncharacterized protein n=1 Tax=Candidatus Nitrosopumilus salarius BD31 TaxID=859350 RepID=I3CZM1_9ARCH|nr:hypothetical protein BD31_I0887 [Candidatus Nitrosopumilus salaria BD31]
MYAKIRSVCYPIMITVRLIHILIVFSGSLFAEIANFVLFAKKS